MGARAEGHGLHFGACSLTHPGCAALLQGEEKERFNEIQQELSKLSTTFTNNVLDATKKFKRLVTSAEEVAGLPESGVRCGFGAGAGAVLMVLSGRWLW